ncbi:hypothetical protein Tco_0171166, partial [Tanacetum coccineum]
QDAVARRFEERSVELDAQIAEVIGHGFRLSMMKCAQSSKCHSALRKVISLAINKGIQQGLEAGIEHGKACRSLAEELEALKDSSLALLMFVLTLEGDHSDADPPPKFLKLQHVSSQVTVTVYFESGGLKGPGSVSGEILLSDAIATLRGHADKRKVGVPYRVVASGSSFVVPSQGNALVVADYQISTLTLTNDVVPVI